MQQRPYEYMLRFGMVPGLCENERLANLLAFCRSSGTTDVMFFYNCEEINRGHFTPDELDEWLELIARMKPVLAAEGITTSINPWTTLLHTDRGRKLRPGQNFTRMVDPSGRAADAVACPICENFLEYLAWQYRSCAEKVRPNVLWIEDDFRLHNHHPLEWGGCFCEKYMQGYSRLAGRELTREEFVSGVLAPGGVHPYRKIWLDAALETMLGVARTIRDAVMEGEPRTRLGLMTSDPVSHCIEGRDWEAVFTALKTEREPCIRIHLPSYQETTAQAYGVMFAAVSRQVRHLTPSRVENYGELENFPFSRFSTSLRFSQMQLETNTLLEGRGITMDIYDMMGNGVLLGEGYQEMLAESRAYVDKLSNLGLEERCQTGVHVLVDPNCCRNIHTEKGLSMHELANRERNLMQLLVPFGIATRYDASRTPKKQVAAVSGQYLRNLSERETKALFDENYILLDGEAVRTLLDINLGALAGIESAVRVPMDNGVNAYEEVTGGDSYCGIRKARMSLQTGTGDFVQVRYRPGVSLKEYTRAFSPFGKDNGPSVAVVEDRVLILPYENYGAALLSPYRKAMVEDALLKAHGFRRPAWVDTPHTTVIRYDMPGRSVFALVNFSGDEYVKLTLTLPDGIPHYNRAVLYTRQKPEGFPAPVECCGTRLIIAQELPRLQMMVLELIG